MKQVHRMPVTVQTGTTVAIIAIYNLTDDEVGFSAVSVVIVLTLVVKVS